MDEEMNDKEKKMNDNEKKMNDNEKKMNDNENDDCEVDRKIKNRLSLRTKGEG